VSPFAIENFNTSAQPNVLALLNNFGAASGNNIEDVLFDDSDNLTLSQVRASQSGGLIINCPMNLTVACASAIPAGATTPAAFLTQGGSASASRCRRRFSDGAPVGSVPCNYTITRTYMATDTRNNSSTCMQTITVHDLTPPTIMCPNSVSVPCYSLVPAPNTSLVTASDTCGGAVAVTFVGDSESNLGSSCNNVITRTYRATDVCGNTATCSQVITINDNLAPTFVVVARAIKLRRQHRARALRS